MKTILITGASSGIGFEVAKYYAGRQYKVYAGGRNQDKLNELAALNSNIITFTCDLTDKASFDNIGITFEPLDILLLNAGNCEYIDDPVNFDGALFERVITTNVISVGYCLDAWLKLVKTNGQLAITSSSASFLPLPRAEAYGASKAALSYLAKTLSIDLQPKKIHVSLIHPGFVETQLTDKNTFDMPSIITADKAASYIFNGLKNKKSEINFPRRFTFILKGFTLLPFFIWKFFMSKTINRTTQE